MQEKQFPWQKFISICLHRSHPFERATLHRSTLHREAHKYSSTCTTWGFTTPPISVATTRESLCIDLFCFVLFCFCFVLFCIVLYCFVFFVLFCIVLYCIVLYCFCFCFVLFWFCFVLFSWSTEKRILMIEVLTCENYVLFCTCCCRYVQFTVLYLLLLMFLVSFIVL